MLLSAARHDGCRTGRPDGSLTRHRARVGCAPLPGFAGMTLSEDSITSNPRARISTASPHAQIRHRNGRPAPTRAARFAVQSQAAGIMSKPHPSGLAPYPRYVYRRFCKYGGRET